MKFARQAKIFRGPLDAAAAASVVMLLMIFLLLSSLLYTPGVLIQLPDGDPLAVTDNPTVVIMVDSGGRCFYDNRPLGEKELKAELKTRVEGASRQSQKLTLVLYPDKAATVQVLSHLQALAHAAGITEVLMAERPAAFGLQQ